MTIDLEDLYPEEEPILLIKAWLFQELIHF
ncbi:MAG: hypothetical protein IPF75_11480 [Bacteroidetes bacterium]|nr:hypothetical protein [Bacteroidota bacterium]